jgi:hypothetical protein
MRCLAFLRLIASRRVMQFDSGAQAISDAFDLLADQQRPGPYAVANDYLSAEMHAGSIFEAVDNMSQGDPDHLKGRECDPADGCEACDKLRASFAVLDAADEAEHVDSNLHGNPTRDRSTLLSTYHLRLHGIRPQPGLDSDARLSLLLHP